MVLILLPTSDNKLLTQWKGPFKVLERIHRCDYHIQLYDKEKIFHANMLKRYISAESESADKPTLSDSEDLDIQVTHAAILEPVEDPILDPYLGTLNPLQKKTTKVVKISSNLSETQKEEVRALLTEFGNIFTDLPSVTNADKHTIELTTAEPIRGKAYPLPLALQETLEREIDGMLAMNIIEDSSTAYTSPVVMVKKPDGSCLLYTSDAADE